MRLHDELNPHQVFFETNKTSLPSVFGSLRCSAYMLYICFLSITALILNYPQWISNRLISCPLSALPTQAHAYFKLHVCCCCCWWWWLAFVFFFFHSDSLKALIKYRIEAAPSNPRLPPPSHLPLSTVGRSHSPYTSV